MKPVIYQLMVRLFGNKTKNVIVNGTIKENGCGKFNDIDTRALSSIRNSGVTHIWYTGILEHAVSGDYSQFEIENDFPEIVKGRAGSPYAIKDYYDVDPDLSVNVENRMKEFDDLVSRTHAAGMKVIIDFIPNHLARVYCSDSKPYPEIEDFGAGDNKNVPFSTFNDFYYMPGEELKLPEEAIKDSFLNEYRREPVRYCEFPAKATGNDCFSASPSRGDWYETVKLNYGIDYLNNKTSFFNPVPPVWEKMKSVILYWTEKKVDGFRVDMAEMVPVEFWEWLIPSVKKKYPALLFIAEIYQPHLYKEFILKGGFDYLYDKVDFYDAVRSVIEGKSDTAVITNCWQRLGDIQQYMLRFLENHDEQRIASRFFAGDPWKALPGMVLAATMSNGPLLLYFGQETGEPADGCSGFSGDDGRTTIYDYWNVPNHQKWMSNGSFNGELLGEKLTQLRDNYSEITNLCNNYKVFSQGGFYDLMWVNDNLKRISEGKLFAFLRHIDSEVALIILNFGGKNLSSQYLNIPEDAINAAGIKGFTELEPLIALPLLHRITPAFRITGKGTVRFDIAGYSALVLFLRDTE